MTSERVYRDRLSLDSAIQELIRGKNTQFDAAIVDVFLKVLGNYDQILEEIKWTYEQLDPTNIHNI